MNADTAAGAFPQYTAEFVDELVRLKAVEREYIVTVRVLAVVVERLLVLTHGKSVSITDEALTACPDLEAYRDDPARAVVISVSR